MLPFLERIWNRILRREQRLRKHKRQLVECLKQDLIEDVLKALLRFMSLAVILDKDLAKHVHDFKANYLFKSKNARITVSAEFKGGRMKVREKEIPDPTTTVVFDENMRFANLLPPNQPDVLDLMLAQRVVVDGNLNYFYKFAYMASLCLPTV